MSTSTSNGNDANNSIKKKDKTRVVEVLDELIFHMNSTRTDFKIMILVFLLFFIGVSIMLASMWLYIGLSEQRFFSNWDKKFSRYTSLKNQLDQLDKELGE